MHIQLQLHYITQHYTRLITLHYATTATTTTLHYTTLHYNYSYTSLHYNTLDHTTLYYATVHSTTIHYNTLYNYTTQQLQLQLQLHYTNYTSLQLTTTTTATTTATATTTTTVLHHSTSSSCEWGDRCNLRNHSKKHNSNHLSFYQCVRSAIRKSQQPTLPIGFVFLKLPPLACAVLLVIVMVGGEGPVDELKRGKGAADFRRLN